MARWGHTASDGYLVHRCERVVVLAVEWRAPFFEAEGMEVKVMSGLVNGELDITQNAPFVHQERTQIV